MTAVRPSNEPGESPNASMQRTALCAAADHGSYAPTIVHGAHMQRRVAIAFMVSLLFQAGCATPHWKTSTYDQFPLNRRRAKSKSELIKVIALVPGGGILADAIGIELAKRGFVVITPTSTVDIASGVDFKAISEHHIPARRAPDEMWKLRKVLRARNVGAFLVVRANDFVPRQHLGYMFWQSATFDIHSTDDQEDRDFGGPIAGAVFVNTHKDRSSSPSETAASMVERLAIRSSK